MITDPSVDFHWFPLDNPGIVSIPLAFFLGWLGTVTSKDHFAGEVRRDGGPLADRRRLREGPGALTAGVVPGDPPPGRGTPYRPGGADCRRRPGLASPRRRAGGVERPATGPCVTDAAKEPAREQREPIVRACPTCCTRSARSRRARSSPPPPWRRPTSTTRPPRTGWGSGSSRPTGWHWETEVGRRPRLAAAVREVVRRRHAQRRVQLRRPARRGRPRRPGRPPLGGRARRHPHAHLRRAARTRSARPPTR